MLEFDPLVKYYKKMNNITKKWNLTIKLTSTIYNNLLLFDPM